MSHDVYQPCPCGSGKKLKFCCADIYEPMMKVLNFQQNHQTRMALTEVSQIQDKHPERPWPGLIKASLLLTEGESRQAKETLGQLKERHSDHPHIVVMHALAAFLADGYEESLPVIDAAFEVGIHAAPDVIGNLAMGIATDMYRQSNFLAAREHLVFALRLAPDREKQNVFVRLLDFDNNNNIPYPLRSVHPLEENAPLEEIRPQFKAGLALVARGHWHQAADKFAELAEAHPAEAALWKNAGLCHAWCGEEAQAAAALHKAAAQTDDVGSAVELETIAQLLDLGQDEQAVPYLQTKYRLNSVSKLLTSLDQQARFERVELPPESLEEMSEQPVGIYHVLDREVPSAESAASLTLEQVPSVLARVTIFDQSTHTNDPPTAFLTGFQGTGVSDARTLFEQAAGGDAEMMELTEDDEDTLMEMPRDLFALYWRYHFPLKTPGVVRKQIENQRWQQCVEDIWPQTPLWTLNGSTPREAAADAERRVDVLAALYVLDSFCDRNGYPLDFDRQCQSMGIEPLPTLEVTEDTPVNSLTVMQMIRLPVSGLASGQLSVVLNRALLVHQDRFLFEVLLEVMKRPECQEQLDLDRVYLTMTQLCADRNDREAEAKYLQQAQDLADSAENAFEAKLQWLIRELTFRLEDPTDEQLKPLLKRLWDGYTAKLPQLKEYLNSIVQMFELTPPWTETGNIITPGGLDSQSSGGVWTPDAPAADTQQSESKLWLPGQS